MSVKILFSITYYHPYVSGLTLAASRWAEGLAKAGNHVSVLCMKHDRSLRDSGETPLRPARPDFAGQVRVVRARPFLRLSKGFLSLDWVVKSWDLVRQNDVVVVNLPQFEGVIPALFARIFGKKTIAIYHCEIVTTPVIQWLMEISHMITLFLADEVVTYTRDYAHHSKLLRSLTILKKNAKITYIVPPIPKPKENKALTKRLKKKIGKTDVVIGVAARLAQEKGIEYLFEALPIIARRVLPRVFLHSHPQRGPRPVEVLLPASPADSVKVVIAGPMEPVGEEAYKEKIMKLVAKHNKRVVFLGSIKPEEMGSFYKLIDVLVLPSVNSTEAFGMVQVEAMRWGVPVVASDLPGVRVPVQDTGMGLVVPPKNAIQLAEAITTVLSQSRSQGKNSIYPEAQSIQALLSLIHQ